MIRTLLFTLSIIALHSCKNSHALKEIQLEKVIIDNSDPEFGYYISVKPQTPAIKGVLVLLPGFGQRAEDIFQDTELYKVASENDLLTIGFSGRMRLTADSLIQEKLNVVINHVLESIEVEKHIFFIGGFSAGGVIALRYTELCHQYPNRFPILPKAVFMADSPVDLFHSWSLLQEIRDNNHSQISVNEANFIERYYKQYYGATPNEAPELYRDLSPFSIDTSLGMNEIYLKDVAVRAYHDIDVSWRIKNRNQTAKFDNYIATSELINRLNLMGNPKAEFMQSYQTGYRRDGSRHPHSWSIIDAEECIAWISNMID